MYKKYIFIIISLQKNTIPLNERIFRVFLVWSSVADPGCLSRIPDPDFYPSRIPDLGAKNKNKREGRKKFVVKPSYVATNSTKM
jgi:hypothetical protein